MAAKTASLSVNIIADAARAKAGLREAETAFGKFRREVGAAQGGVAKFQAVSNAAFASIKQNAVGFATAAGAAVAAFVAKSVLDFQNLSLNIGKFSDATGVTVDQASRLVEVMDDLDVETNALQTALNKLNRAAADGAEGFKVIGAEIVRTSSGAVDVQQTFLNVIDGLRRIQDPALRAAVATQLLGRGWMELAVVVEGGSAKLVSAMNQVSQQKLRTPEQIKQAREFQKSIKDLRDNFEDLAQAVGDNLIPVVKSLADAFNFVASAVRAANSVEIFGVKLSTLGKIAFGIAVPFYGVAQVINQIGNESSNAAPLTENLTAAWRDGSRAMIDAYMSANGLTGEMLGLTSATELATEQWNQWKGELSIELEMLNIQSDIDAFYAKWTQAMADGTFDAVQYQKELLNIQLGLLGIGAETDGLRGKLRDKFKFLVDTSQLQRAVDLINAIRQGLGELKIPTGPGSGDEAFMSKIPGMAAGGFVSSPTVAMVGEAGPEVVIPLSRPSRAMDLMSQSGLDDLAFSMSPMPMSRGTTVININAGSVISENDLIESVRRGLANAQRNGAQLVYSNL